MIKSAFLQLLIYCILGHFCSQLPSYYDPKTGKIIEPKNGTLPDGYAPLKSPDEIYQEKLNAEENSTVCPEDAFTCSTPYNYNESKIYLCRSHEQCPPKHLCCKHSCYFHRVCYRAPYSVNITLNTLTIYSSSNLSISSTEKPALYSSTSLKTPATLKSPSNLVVVFMKPEDVQELFARSGKKKKKNKKKKTKMASSTKRSKNKKHPRKCGRKKGTRNKNQTPASVSN